MFFRSLEASAPAIAPHLLPCRRWNAVESGMPCLWFNSVFPDSAKLHPGYTALMYPSPKGPTVGYVRAQTRLGLT